MNEYETNMELSGSEETPVVEIPNPEVPPKTEETPADPTPEEGTVATETPEEVLYETPDGRKVNAATLQKEWKDNFLPEFTRKSQKLAEMERGKDITNADENTPAWKKADYTPESYAEVIEYAKKEALQEIQNTYKAEQDRMTSIQTEVDSQISALKTADPKLDENALFAHANKYGFQDLKTAYANMSDMKKSLVDMEQRTVKNLKTRESDPISTGHGSDIPEVSGYDPKEMGMFNSAAEYLASLKAKK